MLLLQTLSRTLKKAVTANMRTGQLRESFCEHLHACRDIFFPALCFACGDKIENGFVCSRCMEKIVFLSPPLCRYCAQPLSDSKSGVCTACRGKKFPYAGAISLTLYNEIMKELIHSFKYKNHDYLEKFFSKIMRECLEKIGFQCAHDYVTCVPMHPLKLKERGYNQSALLAAALAKYVNIPFRNDIIYEKKAHASQTKLTSQERRTNASIAFAAKEALTDHRIILVDDIFTTGATVNACASALKEKGAGTITVITLSKTLL